jgi:hypothetical protein
MIKLHPETAEAIAGLILKIDVARIMQRNPAYSSDRIYWMADEYKEIIKLTEEYGIPHNLYDTAIEGMKKDLFANATL